MKILSYHFNNHLDEVFLETINELFKQYPFKMFYFIDIFIKNNNVFIKDTTIIIKLLNLKNEDIKRLFEISKILLNKKIITKVIYKKEVIILNFFDNFVVSFFQNYQKWLSITINFIMKNKLHKTYYDVYLKENDEIIYCDFLIIIDEYFITINQDLNNKISDKHIPLVINLYNNILNNLLYCYNEEELYDNIINKIKY